LNYSSYGPSGINVNTQAPGSSLPGGPGVDQQFQGLLGQGLAFKQNMANRGMALREGEAADASKMRAMQMQALEKQQGWAQQDRDRNTPQERPMEDPRMADLNRLRRQDEMAAINARLHPAPMKGVTGFNMIGNADGADVMDTQRMGFHQRQAYLPKESGIVSPGTAVPTGSIRPPSSAPIASPQDPFPNGTGTQFAAGQMANALERSNYESAARYQKEQGGKG